MMARRFTSAGLERKSPLRGKALFLRLSDDQREQIVRVASRNKRSITDEVMRRLMATLAHDDWEDRLNFSTKHISNKEALVKALTEAMTKTLGELAASENPDTASVKAKTAEGESAGLKRKKTKGKEAEQRKDGQAAA
jgi:hypothetical protein